MANLDRGKCFDVKLRIKSAQLLHKIEIPVFFQCGMQPADHVHLRHSEAERIAHHADDFVNRVLKGVCIALFSGESAELAGEQANVGVIDVAIVDISCVVAVLSLTHNVGNYSEGVKIVRAIESESI